MHAPRSGFLPLFFCGAVLAVLSPVFWLTTRLPHQGQARTYENLPLYERVYPAVHYGASRLSAGEWPLWDPWSLCGTEFLANPRNGVLQPLNLILLGLPVDLALTAHAFLCSFVMALTFLLFVRGLGVRLAPAMLGACVYAFSGASAAVLSLPEYASFLAWLPLCFWGVRATCLGARHAVPVLGTSLALTFLSGALDAVLAGGVVLVLYAVYLTIFSARSAPQPRAQALRRLRNAVLVGAALSAAQWLPALAWAWHRGALMPFGEGTFQAALPNGTRELVQQLFGVQDSGLLPPLAYFGVVGLLVLPTAFFHRHSRGDALFFFGVAALGLLAVVFGRSGWDARTPFESLAFPGTFAVAALAALGADRLFETGRDPRSPNVWGPLLLVAAFGAVLFYFLPAMGRGIAAVFFVVAVLPSVVVRLRWMAAACASVATMLLFVDLASALAQHSLHPYVDAASTLNAVTPGARSAQEQAIQGRVVVNARPLDATMIQNLGAARELRCAGGLFQAMTPAQEYWWGLLGGTAQDAVVSASASQPGLLNYMAVRAILAAPDAPILARKWASGTPRLRPVLSEGSLQVLVNDDALPRAYWVPRWRAAESTEAALTNLGAPDFQGRGECTVQGSASLLERLAKSVPAGSGAASDALVEAGITVDLPERVELAVKAPSAGITVLADTWAPGWRVLLDGQEANILQVNGLFRGVATPPGRHTLVFSYRPTLFYVGLGISLLSCAVLVLWGGTRYLMGRKTA